MSDPCYLDRRGCPWPSFDSAILAALVQAVVLPLCKRSVCQHDGARRRCEPCSIAPDAPATVFQLCCHQYFCRVYPVGHQLHQCGHWVITNQRK